MPKTSPQPSTDGTAPPRTAAETLLLVTTWTDLKDDRRRDLANGLNTMVALAGLPADAVLMDVDARFAEMDGASPNALGIRPSTFANRYACVRYVFRRIGLLAARRVRTPAVSDPAWAPLLAHLDDGARYGRLKAFIAYCVGEGIAPEAVGPETLDGFAEARRIERGGAKARDHARRAGVQWNLAVKEIEGWPAVRLGLRPVGNQMSLPFSAYPETLQREAEGYLTGIAPPQGDDLFPEEGQTARKPVSTATATARKYCLRRLLWGAVQSGTPVEELTSLRQVTEPAFIKASLNWHRKRAGEVNDDLAQLAATIASVSKYLDVSMSEWAAIKRLLDRVKPPSREGLTERNEELLLALDDEKARIKLINLPGFLMKRAARMRDGWTDHRDRFHPPQPLNAAWLAAVAAAIEILLHVPLRIKNLQELRLGQELRLTAVNGRRWRGDLRVSYVRTKTKEPLSMPLGDETIALLRDYVENHRGNLANAQTTWLFPGTTSPDRPRDKQAFGQAISEVIQDFVGVRVNPHAFRAFAGSVILKADPNAIDDVRAILGHRSFETALIYYRRHNQRAAAERLSATLAGERRKTRTNALSQLMAPELRRRRRRAT